jgi:hypothetical protein
MKENQKKMFDSQTTLEFSFFLLRSFSSMSDLMTAKALFLFPCEERLSS